MKNTRTLGMEQEARALRFLQRKGLRLVQRNFTARFGEIDLIMLQPPTHLVFVEVRYRKSGRFGGALASVTPQKQLRIKRTAALFLQKQIRFRALASRFDVIAMPSATGGEGEIQWIRNAFC